MFTLLSPVRRTGNDRETEDLQAKRLMQEYLSDCLLSVKFPAESLHCSTDYLSNLDHMNGTCVPVHRSIQ
jgi:hypothetical protein